MARTRGSLPGVRLRAFVVVWLLGCDRTARARPRLDRCPAEGCGAPVNARPRESECRAVIDDLVRSATGPAVSVTPFWLALCARADRSALACGREAEENADHTIAPRFLEACLLEKWLRAALREGFDDVVRAAWLRGALPGRTDRTYRVPSAITGLPAEIELMAIDHWRGQNLRFYVTTSGHCADHLEGVLCADAPIGERDLRPPTDAEYERARGAPWLRRDVDRRTLRWIELPTRGLLATCVFPSLEPTLPPSRFLHYDRIDARCAYASRAR